MKSVSTEEIVLDDGSRIRLIDTLSAPKGTPAHEVSNNIYRISPTGETMWQVEAGSGIGDREAPFTGMKVDEEGRVVAFRWDGNLFAIDVETGKATFLRFVK